MFKNKQKALLSDHMPFIAKNHSVALMGWNILNSMQFNTTYKYYNNGFNCPEESMGHFLNRLSHTVAQINDVIEKESPAFICLQECPETEETCSHFAKEIKNSKGTLKDYGMEVSKNDVYLITFYNKALYTIDTDLTPKMAETQLEDGLAKRVLPLAFRNNNTNEIMLVVNVHAKFPKEIQKDVIALYKNAVELGIKEMTLIGDFNRDLVLQSDNYSKHDISSALDSDGKFSNLYVNAVSSSSFCSQYNKETEEKGQGIETRDGIMSTFKSEITPLTRTNSTNSTLLINKPVAPRLTFIPNGFIEKLEEKYQNNNVTSFECN